jgi:hypothetical protein
MGWTTSDLIALQARKLAKASPCATNEGCNDESELHEQIRQECLHRGWMAFHGSMAHRAYRTPGEPDYVICCHEGKLLMIECKTRVGKLSTEQLGVAAWAAKLGHQVHTVRSYEEFLNVANQVNHHDNGTNDGIQTVRPIRD